ncbi:MAG: PHP domain-containing protein, partial [Methanosarcinales archaeon]|nr:PHP domain-containing protein [Methanosarcinales archaeon]
MIDLHTHTVFSDGELIPAELIRRAEVLGTRAIAITDHCDFTNVDHIVSSLKRAKTMCEGRDIDVFAGVELTHVPPEK